MADISHQTNPEPKAAIPPENQLESDKARRIVEAMRRSIGKLGHVNSTFDVVAREAGVSRGLLHYYFGSKERLMIEVVRVEAAQRIEAINTIAAHVHTAEQIMNVLLAQLEEWVKLSTESYMLIYEMLGEGMRNEEIGVAYREMRHGIEDAVVTLLDRMQDEGELKMRGGTLGVTRAIIAMGHGLALELLADPDANHEESTARIIEASMFLLGQE